MVALLGVIVGAIRRARDRTTPRPVARLLGASAALAVCYSGVLIVSRLATDPGIPFDEPILAPLLLVATVAVVTSAVAAWPKWGLLLRGVVGGSFIVWLAASASVSLDEATWATTNGSDFASADWRHSQLLDWVRRNAPTAPLYSNWPAAVYFNLDRPACLLPSSQSNSRDWREFSDTLARRGGGNGGLVVAFDAPSPNSASPDRIAPATHLRVVARVADGVVYAAPAAPANGR